MEDFFIGIYSPNDVRRGLLESSREIVLSMQNYDVLSKIRVQKLDQYQELAKTMRELNLLIGKLKKCMPDTHLRKIHVSQMKKGEGIEAPEMNKLRKQLEELEKELEKLT